MHKLGYNNTINGGAFDRVQDALDQLAQQEAEQDERPAHDAAERSQEL